jgi:two-component system response regulator EvgA
VATRTPASRALCHDPLVGCGVLIVDDHAGFRAQARALLEAAGFDVLGEAGDGAAALAAAPALGADVVLLDVQLPDMDGFEVASRLRSAGAGPAIVLTSSCDASDFGSLIGECGAVGFIAKCDLSGERLRELLA